MPPPAAAPVAASMWPAGPRLKSSCSAPSAESAAWAAEVPGSFSPSPAEEEAAVQEEVVEEELEEAAAAVALTRTRMKIWSLEGGETAPGFCGHLVLS